MASTGDAWVRQFAKLEMTTHRSVIVMALVLSCGETAQGDVTPASLVAEIQKTRARETVNRLYEEKASWSVVKELVGSLW